MRNHERGGEEVEEVEEEEKEEGRRIYINIYIYFILRYIETVCVVKFLWK